MFGSGNPAAYSGLSPTFTIFSTVPGVSQIGISSVVSPGVTELITGSGLYYFTYGATVAIAFVADGGNTLSNTDRYIKGILDPIQAVDQVVGTQLDSFGSTSVDPSTLFGMAKRNQEFEEGDKTFNSQTGQWQILSRGSSTLLRTKQLANNVGTIGSSGL